MAKQTPSNRHVLFYGAMAFFIIIAGIFGYLYVKANADLTIANTNLLLSKTNYTSLQSQFNLLTSKYNVNEYNLTHPYTQVLFYQKTVNLPRYNYTYTYNSVYNYNTGLYSGYMYNYTYTWGRFNYSFNAPFPGYLMFNATSTISNNPNPSVCWWNVYESNKLGWRNFSTTKSTLYNITYTYYNHFLGNDGLFINLTSTPWVDLCPLQSVTYYIPVAKGKNYLIIDNNNASQGITVTFSAEYVGFHNS